MDTNREKLRFGNAECEVGHPLWLASEGYAYCREARGVPYEDIAYYAWRLTQPSVFYLEPWTIVWQEGFLKDGTKAWVTLPYVYGLDTILEVIQYDMDRERALQGEPSPLLSYNEWLAAVS